MCIQNGKYDKIENKDHKAKRSRKRKIEGEGCSKVVVYDRER